MSHVLHIDIETYCDLELKDVGVFKYAEHDSFSVLMLAYAIDDQPIKITEDIASVPELKFMIESEDYVKIAHNANFEMTCLSKHFNINPKQWVCTMVMASQLGYPSSLDKCSEVMQLGEQKDKEGKALINFFSRPGKKGRNFPKDSPEKWEAFKRYCIQDVATERAIHKALAPLSDIETDLYVLDYGINKRGVQLDLDLAKKAILLSGEAHANALDRLKIETGLDNPTDNQLRAKYGIESLTSKGIPALRRERPELSNMLDLRAIVRKSSIAKYLTMLDCACNDGRARGLTMFMGAGRTGRWSGRLIQTQNMPRITVSDKELATAREVVKSGDNEVFDLLYGDERLTFISQLIRTAIIPKPGHAFVVADFSAIEARVLAWLSNEQWRLDVFNGDGRIYETSAERMFNLEPGSVRKGSPLRQKGKIAELALGYGGGPGALVAMGALDNGLTEDELPGLVQLWRQASPNITYFWAEVDATLKAAIGSGIYVSPLLLKHGITINKRKNLLQITLPSGRKLSYVNPHFGPRNNVYYYGVDQLTKQWTPQKLYGAKATENIVQAVARDCLAGVLERAEAFGLPPVFHVHDEVICEVPEEDAEKGLQKLLSCMARPWPWSQGLPLIGDGFVCKYYEK
jgi:DNA polymerase